jgi:hypothetical protein
MGERAVVNRVKTLRLPDGRSGTDEERLTPLALSPRPDRRSRALFTDDQLEADLNSSSRCNRTTAAGRSDWLAWSPGQRSSGAGCDTAALATLGAHGRIRLARTADLATQTEVSSAPQTRQDGSSAVQA